MAEEKGKKRKRRRSRDVKRHIWKLEGKRKRKQIDRARKNEKKPNKFFKKKKKEE